MKRLWKRIVSSIGYCGIINKEELSVQNGIHKSQSRCIHDKRDNDDDANDDVLD